MRWDGRAKPRLSLGRPDAQNGRERADSYLGREYGGFEPDQGEVDAYSGRECNDA